MAVLVLGDSEDIHISSVCHELEANDQEILVLDVWKPWKPITLAYTDNKTVASIQSKSISIQSVWLRLKPRFGRGLSEEDAFAVRERRDFLMGLTALSGTINLINDPWKQAWAKSKPIQLAIANRTGLSIPKTWISNDVDALASIGRMVGGSLVYKPLTWLASLDGKVLFTNSVTIEDLINNKQAIECAPGIFQEIVQKSCEYRITIIDEQVFTVRIFSQELNDTTLDWRRNQRDVRYEKCTLPEYIESKLLNLMHELGLRYAAIDLIETINGEYIFLEANPGGNWFWLEKQVGIPISKALASSLSKEPFGVKQMPNRRFAADGGAEI